MPWLEIAGTLTGLVYIYLEYKASVWLWLTGIIMPAIYIFVYYDAGFYADMGINVYYLIAGLYGWALWLGLVPSFRRRKGAAARFDASGGAAGSPTPDREQDHKTSRRSLAEATPEGNGPFGSHDEPGAERDMDKTFDLRAGSQEAATARSAGKKEILPITRTPRRLYLPLAGIVLVSFVVIAWILITFTDSSVPYGDSFTTALSVVGLWMLARKWVEQWLVWIVVDVVCAGLYFYKALYPTAVLYALYAVIAVFGYFKWQRMMRSESGLNG